MASHHFMVDHKDRAPITCRACLWIALGLVFAAGVLLGRFL